MVISHCYVSLPEGINQAAKSGILNSAISNSKLIGFHAIFGISKLCCRGIADKTLIMHDEVNHHNRSIQMCFHDWSRFGRNLEEPGYQGPILSIIIYHQPTDWVWFMNILQNPKQTVAFLCVRKQATPIFNGKSMLMKVNQMVIMFL